MTSSSFVMSRIQSILNQLPRSIDSEEVSMTLSQLNLSNSLKLSAEEFKTVLSFLSRVDLDSNPIMSDNLYQISRFITANSGFLMSCSDSEKNSLVVKIINHLRGNLTSRGYEHVVTSKHSSTNAIHSTNNYFDSLLSALSYFMAYSTPMDETDVDVTISSFEVFCDYCVNKELPVVIVAKAFQHIDDAIRNCSTKSEMLHQKLGPSHDRLMLCISKLVEIAIDRIRTSSARIRSIISQSFQNIKSTVSVSSVHIDTTDLVALLVNCMSFLSTLYSWNKQSSSFISDAVSMFSKTNISRFTPTVVQVTHTILDRVLEPLFRMNQMYSTISNTKKSIQVPSEPVVTANEKTPPRRSLRPSSDPKSIKPTAIVSKKLPDEKETWVRGQQPQNVSMNEHEETLFTIDASIRWFCFKLLGDVASHSPPGFLVQYWSLFLTESVATEALCLEQLQSELAAKAESNVTLFDGKLRSPLLSCVHSSYSSIVQIEAVKTLKALLINAAMSLNKWLKLLSQTLSIQYQSENRSSSVPAGSRVSNAKSSQTRELANSKPLNAKFSHRTGSRGFAGDQMVGSVVRILVCVISLLKTQDEALCKELLSIVRLFVDSTSSPGQYAASNKFREDRLDRRTVLEDLGFVLIGRVQDSCTSCLQISINYLKSNTNDANKHQPSDNLALPNLIDTQLLNQFQVKAFYPVTQQTNTQLPNYNLTLLVIDWLTDICKKSKMKVVEDLLKGKNESVPFMMVKLSDVLQGYLFDTSLQPGVISCLSAVIVRIRDYVLAISGSYHHLIISFLPSLKNMLLTACRQPPQNSGYTGSKLPPSSLLSNHLFALKMLGCILDQTKKASSNISVVMPVDQGTSIFSHEDIFELISYSIECSDHQVRSAIVSLLGKLPVSWYAEYPIDKEFVLPGQPVRSVCPLTIILNTAIESVGTVRVAAYQAMGEILSDGGLNHIIDSAARSTKNSFEFTSSNRISAESNKQLMAIVKLICKGCQDSKLAVRLQSLWALGNLLLLLLPYRQQYTFNKPSIDMTTEIHNIHPSSIGTIGSSSSSPVASHNHKGDDSWILSDQTWIEICDVCLNSLEDSDKLLASSVRCLGFLAAGLSPWDYIHFAHTSDIINSIIRRALLTEHDTSKTSLLVSEKDDLEAKLRSSVVHGSHKLLHAATQTLGFVAWVLITRGPNDHENAGSRVLTYIDILRIVQAEMLRFGGNTKTQLQACRSLIALTYKETSSSSDLTQSIEEGLLKQVRNHSSLLNCFEAALVVLTPTRLAVMHSTKHFALVNSEQQRRVDLCRLLLVLIWIFIENISSHVDSSGLSVLSYHVHDVLSFLNMFVPSQKALPKSSVHACLEYHELSMTSPPLLQTAPLNFRITLISSTKPIGSELPSCMLLAKDVSNRMLKLFQDPLRESDKSNGIEWDQVRYSDFYKESTYLELCRISQGLNEESYLPSSVNGSASKVDDADEF